MERVTIIKPSKSWQILKINEIREYKELLYFLVWRNLKVRYKQTAIGALWAIIQPFLTMVVFTLFFGKLAKIPSGGIPYPIFYFSALIIWTYFANSLTFATNSIVSYQHIITKIYFPRIFLPLASVIEQLIDFFIAFIILIGMMFFYHIIPTSRIFFMPLFVFLAIIAAFGVGLWFSALNVQYRDVKYAINFILQIWLFASPIAYSSTLVPAKWRNIYGLNPMVGIIEGFKWTILGKPAPDIKEILISTLIVFVILITGLFYFKNMERTFADVV
ncbi:MAG: ABC transporter permease [Candidatus Omnitrophica bacterium]|jgi:lipopolysaccharide transport system permease protein|nr:ABC transporter permease [Candidatus Omnitrophota bacterium]